MIGSNLLNIALGQIGRTPIQFVEFQRNILQPNGVLAPQYADPVVINDAIVQPVNTHVYLQQGMYVSEKRIKIWASTDIKDLSRTTSGDRVLYDGDQFQVVGDTAKWLAFNGWVEVEAIKIIEDDQL